MAARVWISEIKFSDDTKVNFSKNDIILLVGPNNSGKSATLKEAAKILKQPSYKGKVLKVVDFEKEGGESELLAFLQERSTIQFGVSQEPHYTGHGFNIYGPNAKSWWEFYKQGLSDLFPLFVGEISTEKRLEAANPPVNIRITTEAPHHPIHHLQRNDILEKRFSDYFKQAFGTELIVHRNAGAEVPLYVGSKPVIKEGDNATSFDYLTELEKLDLLHEQGDGMRSFVGVLLNAFISTHSVLFIDEPEAFLHHRKPGSWERCLPKIYQPTVSCGWLLTVKIF